MALLVIGSDRLLEFYDGIRQIAPDLDVRAFPDCGIFGIEMPAVRLLDGGAARQSQQQRQGQGASPFPGDRTVAPRAWPAGGLSAVPACFGIDHKRIRCMPGWTSSIEPQLRASFNREIERYPPHDGGVRYR